jgi:hypothetical protein
LAACIIGTNVEQRDFERGGELVLRILFDRDRVVRVRLRSPLSETPLVGIYASRSDASSPVGPRMFGGTLDAQS